MQTKLGTSSTNRAIYSGGWRSPLKRTKCFPLECCWVTVSIKRGCPYKKSVRKEKLHWFR